MFINTIPRYLRLARYNTNLVNLLTEAVDCEAKAEAESTFSLLKEYREINTIEAIEALHLVSSKNIELERNLRCAQSLLYICKSYMSVIDDPRIILEFAKQLQSYEEYRILQLRDRIVFLKTILDRLLFDKYIIEKLIDSLDESDTWNEWDDLKQNEPFSKLDNDLNNINDLCNRIRNELSFMTGSIFGGDLYSEQEDDFELLKLINKYEFDNMNFQQCCDIIGMTDSE